MHARAHLTTCYYYLLLLLATCCLLAAAHYLLPTTGTAEHRFALMELLPLLEQTAGTLPSYHPMPLLEQTAGTPGVLLQP